MEKTCVCCCIELMNELSFQNFSAGKKIFLEGLKKVWKITCETLILFRNYFWIIFNLNACHCVKGVRIRRHSGPHFLHLDWIRRDTEDTSVFSPNAGKCRPEQLRIRTLFAQCIASTYLWLWLYLSILWSASLHLHKI